MKQKQMSESNLLNPVEYFWLLCTCVHILVSMIVTTLSALVKVFVPYKYRCKSVKDNIVLITGAGSGLGKLMAKKMSKLGAQLVLVDVDERSNQETAKEIVADGGVAHTFTCDLSKREEIYKLGNQVKKVVGDVDILVNNAGIVTGKRFLESSDESIERTMAVNTMAHFWMVKIFLPSMLEKNYGHVVTIASVAGLYGTPSLCDYSASKSAVIGFDDSLRNELIRLEKTGVKTTCVCPYYINTGMFTGASSPWISFLEPDYATDKIIEAILTDQPFLLMPRGMYFFYAFKGLVSVETEQLGRNHIFKSTNSMDQFMGRTKTN